MTEKPYLLVDVDGVLNPLSFWAKNSVVTRFVEWVGHDIYVPSQGRSYLVHLNETLHKPMFERLAEHYTMMWATTWDVEAQTLIAPKLGLPKWDVVPMCNSRSAEYKEYYGGNYAWSPLYSKTKPIAKWAEENNISRFAWVDDQAFVDDQAYFDGRGLKGKVFTIDSAEGLTLEDEKNLIDWAVNGDTEEADDLPHIPFGF